MEYALEDKDKLTPAAKADRRKTHTCPECQATVTLKRGLQRSPHFAHEPYSSCRLAVVDYDRTLYRERYQRQEERRELLRVDRREYYAQNSERILAYQALYREENRDHINEIAKFASYHRKAKNDHVRIVARDYRIRQHLDVIVLIERRRARKLNLPDNWTVNDWLHALDHFDHRCAVCGKVASGARFLAADHWIPLASNQENNPGTVPWNMVPLCHGSRGCNNSKGALHPREWLKKSQGNRWRSKADEIEGYLKRRYDHYHPREAGWQRLLGFLRNLTGFSNRA
jgi:endogenous inhibitor of DNA gyrase (YacG/DUF329 family)